MVGVVRPVVMLFNGVEMKDITTAIKERLRYYDGMGYSPYSINCGICDEFAQDLQSIFPSGEAIWGEDSPELFVTDDVPMGHCFFKYKEKYYDSESIYGENIPDNLNYYKRILKNNKCLTY